MRRLIIPAALRDEQDETLTAIHALRTKLWNEQLSIQEKLAAVDLPILKLLYQDAVDRVLEEELDGEGFAIWAKVTSVPAWNADIPDWFTDFDGNQVTPVITDATTDPPTTRPRKVSDMPGARVIDSVGYCALSMPQATPRDDGGYNGTHYASLKTIRRAALIAGITLIEPHEVPIVPGSP